MKKKRIQGWLAVAALVTSLWSGTPVHAESIGKEVEIKPDQPQPSRAGVDLSKDYAVWMNEGDQEYAIVVYDLDNHSEKRIENNGYKKTEPKVDGNIVVWIDYRNSEKGDVYLYDLQKKEEKRLTTDGAVPEDVNVDGNVVVWTDKRNGQSDVYAYNLSGGKLIQLSASGKASSPAVSKNYVVWQDQRNGNWDIYGYSLSTGKEEQITKNSAGQLHPAIYNGDIVYEDMRNNNKELYLYSLSTRKEKRLTNSGDNEEHPQIYGSRVTYVVNNDLMYYDLDEEDERQIERNISDKIWPSFYGDNVMYVNDDREGLHLYLYNLDDEEASEMGSELGIPSQPDGDDNWIVYIRETKKSTDVVLYNVATTKTTTVTESSNDPSRPLVSNRWVVWYDDNKDGLLAYEISTGKRLTVSDRKSEPNDELYELDGDNLVWVDEASEYDVKWTDLKTGKTKTVAELNRRPRSVDVKGSRIAWLADEGSNNGRIYYYDMKTGKDDIITRERAQLQDARLGDEFVVWSKNEGNNWNLYYYDFEDERIYPVFRNSVGDQIHPQASGDMIFFEDNRYSRDKKVFDYFSYDIMEGEYSYAPSSEAVIEDIRFGGNRLVWVDKRDDEDHPVLYTMALTKPKDDGGGDPGTDPVSEYRLIELIENDSFGTILDENPPEKVELVFYPGTSRQEVYNMIQVAENLDRVLQLLSEEPIDEVLVRVYH